MPRVAGLTGLTGLTAAVLQPTALQAVPVRTILYSFLTQKMEHKRIPLKADAVRLPSIPWDHSAEFPTPTRAQTWQAGIRSSWRVLGTA